MAPPRYLHIALAAAVFLAGILLAGPSTCWAVGIEGTVQSIDVAARKLSLTRKTANGEKTVSLDVSAEAGDLSSLKKGDRVVIEYDPEQEVAKSIAVGAPVLDGDAVAKSLGELQGTWIAVKMETNEQPLAKVDVRRQHRRITIKGDSYEEDFARARDGKVLKIVGKFEIDPKTRKFDLVGKGPQGTYLEYAGLYEVKEGRLHICVRANIDGNAQRPKELGSAAQGPNWAYYNIFERDEDEGPAKNKSP